MSILTEAQVLAIRQKYPSSPRKPRPLTFRQCEAIKRRPKTPVLYGIEPTDPIRKYGITPRQKRANLRTQGKVCAICQRPPKENKVLNLDHCHDTNRPRGWLCDACNLLLGVARDKISVLLRACQYLEREPIVPEMHPGYTATEYHNFKEAHKMTGQHVKRTMTYPGKRTIQRWANLAFPEMPESAEDRKQRLLAQPIQGPGYLKGSSGSFRKAK